MRPGCRRSDATMREGDVLLVTRSSSEPSPWVWETHSSQLWRSGCAWYHRRQRHKIIVRPGHGCKIVRRPSSASRGLSSSSWRMGGYRWRGQGHGAVLVSGGRRGLARCRYDEECAAGIALGWRAVAGVLATSTSTFYKYPPTGAQQPAR
jgi:hypothetical protein